MVWEWRGDPPQADDYLRALGELPPVWGIDIVKYSDYVLPMTKNTKEKDEKGREVYVAITRLYMQAAGRVRMLNDGAEQYGWEVNEAWEKLNESPLVLRVNVSISPMDRITLKGDENALAKPYGNRYGLSKLKGGDNAWEKAETQARGRALGAWGFGVIPGSGIASAEEMQDARSFDDEGGPEAPSEQTKLSTEELTARLLDLRAELAQVRGSAIEDLDAGLQSWVKKRWNLDMPVSESGPDLSVLKDGQLVLMHNEMLNQLKLARADDARAI